MNSNDIDRIIEMAWEDITTFDAIKMQFGIDEKDVIKIFGDEKDAFRIAKNIVKHRSIKKITFDV